MARDFNGSSDINYTLNAGQTGSATMTWAWWEYLDSNAQYRRPWHWGNVSGSADSRMEMDDGWGFVLVAGRTTTQGVWSITKPSTGSWHHVACTYDYGSTTNDPIIYINGVSQAITERVSPAGTGIYNTTPFYLGSERGTGQYMDGRMAEFGIWHRILSQSEVNILNAGFSPLFIRNSLKVYFPLIGNDTDEADLMYGITGSVDAGVTKIAHPRIIYPTSINNMFTAAAAAANLRRYGLTTLGVS